MYFKSAAAAAAAAVTTPPYRRWGHRPDTRLVCSDCVVLWHMFAYYFPSSFRHCEVALIRASLLQDLVYCKCAGLWHLQEDPGNATLPSPGACRSSRH